MRILHSRWQEVKWWTYLASFDGIFWDPYPFNRNTVDGWAWHKLVHRLVRPGGKFVNYMIYGTREEAWSCGTGWPPAISLDVETCQVEVPFEIPEWRGLGVGKHQIYIPVHTKLIRPLLAKRRPLCRRNGRHRW